MQTYDDKTQSRETTKVNWFLFDVMANQMEPDTLHLKITLTMNMKVGLSEDLKWRVQKARQS